MKQETKDKIKKIGDKTSNIIVGLVLILTIFVIILTIVGIFNGEDITNLLTSLIVYCLICLYVTWSFTRRNPLIVIKEHFQNFFKGIKNFILKFKKKV